VTETQHAAEKPRTYGSSNLGRVFLRLPRPNHSAWDDGGASDKWMDESCGADDDGYGDAWTAKCKLPLVSFGQHSLGRL